MILHRLILILISMSCAVYATDDQQARPHIVFINVDDWGYKDSEFMGSPYYETPNMDRLSEDGMVFTQAYAAAANCAPSRASLMTGQYTPRHKIYTVGKSTRGKSRDRRLMPIRNQTTLDPAHPTLAERLQSVGYQTVTIGKWHLSDDPEEYGFDKNIAGTHRGHPSTYFSPYKNPKLKNGPKGEYLTDRLTDEAIRILQQKREQPLFLYLPYFTVHTPLQAKSQLIKKYEEKSSAPGQSNATYAAMVEALDTNVGRLLEVMRAVGMEPNTMVLLTSDNGGIRAVSSQHPLRAGKGSYYEGGIRVPLVVKWPGKIRPGTNCDVPVANIDFFPTFLDAIGIQRDSTDVFDGVSLMPVLTGGEIADRDLFWHFPIYLQAYRPNRDDGRDPLFRTRPGSVIRSGKWKLHEYFEDAGIELYDLENDPGERRNLAETNSHVAGKLLTRLRDWRESIQAPVPKQKNLEFRGG